jgi:hypothetical protein
LEQTDKNGWTALELAVHFGFVDSLKALVDAGCRVDVEFAPFGRKVIYDFRSLSLAGPAYGRAIENVEILVNFSPTLLEKIPIKTGPYTPLRICVWRGWVEGCKTRVEAGAQVPIMALLSDLEEWKRKYDEIDAKNNRCEKDNVFDQLLDYQGVVAYPKSLVQDGSNVKLWFGNKYLDAHPEYRAWLLSKDQEHLEISSSGIQARV